jgi:hypothetical protein
MVLSTRFALIKGRKIVKKEQKNLEFHKNGTNPAPLSLPTGPCYPIPAFILRLPSLAAILALLTRRRAQSPRAR